MRPEEVAYLVDLAGRVLAMEGLAGYRLVLEQSAPRVDGILMGLQEGRTIRLYLPAHASLPDAVDTLLHEVAHAKAGPGHGPEFWFAYEELRKKYM